MITRIIRKRIEQTLSGKKAVLLLGPRQVGKTTMLTDIHTMTPGSLFLDCDEPDVRALLTDATSTSLRAFLGSDRLVIIDEAQRVRNIGLTLKLIIDKLKDLRLIISGSSALELSNDISEPLTGRKTEILMAGISYEEMELFHGSLEETRLLETRLIYGMYPEIISFPDRAEQSLRELTSGYLYKDVFNYQDIRKPELLHNLTEALARRVGMEVSYNELAKLLYSDPGTIGRYIQLLEKSMVIFRLRSFSRNLRNELKKSRKIYFYDNGIRNAVLGDFRPVSLRSDAGMLWENYMLSERLKYNMNHGHYYNTYFWRTKQQQAIDYIEDRNGQLSGYEFKYGPNKAARFSKTFTDEYKPARTETVNVFNYRNFVT